MNIINLYENYNSYFSAEYKSVLELCSKIAAKSGYKLYLIGGLVRDMLLNQKSFDIDITVEGDAIAFAHVLEREDNAKILSIHKDFGTVKVLMQGAKIDFASTRSETYPKKGHLPKVAEIGCPLEKDVLRRDFTINSLALSLNQDSFADLIDYVGGFEDLKKKKIKILHDKSFIDDPTRIIRALKYSTRLGFELDATTFTLQTEYLQNINYDMCNKRIKQEIKKTFNHCHQKAFVRFIEQGLYKLITKNEIKTPKINIENLITKYAPKHSWLVYFGVVGVVGVVGVLEEEKLLDKLELTKPEKEIIIGAKSLLNVKLEDDFALYKAFHVQKLETLLILAISGREKEIFHYLDDLKHIKLLITGDDLLKLGYTPSKAFSDGFDYALREKLKTPWIKKSEELKLIKDYFDSICP